MSNRERDLEITRRREAGESPADLAREFGVSAERVWQIVTATQRRLRGEPPKRRSRAMPKPKPAPIRPRLRPIDGRMEGRWSCGCDVLTQQGATPKEAYDLWLNAAILQAMPPTVPEEPASAAPVAVKPDSVPPAKLRASVSQSAVSEPALTPVHASQVQVLPGVSGRRPLSFASSLGLNADRIAAAQPRLQSLHGAGRGPNGGFHGQE